MGIDRWLDGMDECFIVGSQPGGKAEVNVLHFECAAFAVENAISLREGVRAGHGRAGMCAFVCQ